MRSSCETEWLNDGIPAHVVAGWMGHSVQGQRQSYAQITDGHFEKFNRSEPIAQTGSECGSDDAGNGENSPENVSHNMSHQPLKRRKPRKTLSFRGSRVAEERLEPVNEKTGKTEQPSSTGQILASLEPATSAAFAELLHTEYGFSDVQVARILEAAERAAVELST